MKKKKILLQKWHQKNIFIYLHVRFFFFFSSRCLENVNVFYECTYFFLPQEARRANWIIFDTTHNTISRGRLTALILNVFFCILHINYNMLLNSRRRHSRSLVQKTMILFYCCFSRFTMHKITYLHAHIQSVSLRFTRVHVFAWLAMTRLVIYRRVKFMKTVRPWQNILIIGVPRAADRVYGGH